MFEMKILFVLFFVPLISTAQLPLKNTAHNKPVTVKEMYEYSDTEFVRRVSIIQGLPNLPDSVKDRLFWNEFFEIKSLCHDHFAGNYCCCFYANRQKNDSEFADIIKQLTQQNKTVR